MTESTTIRPRDRLILLAFALSGAAALMYEVIWTRALSLVLGSTAYALSTMLATFMSGLAIGGWIGGRLADKRPDPIILFGWCELGIAITGFVTVPVIYLLPKLYFVGYRSFHDYPGAFFTMQVVLCALVMIVPTTLMGATFPLVSRALTESLAEIGRKVGAAYSINTVGAVIGSLSVGFFFIPFMGMRGAVTVAAGINLVTGIGALIVGRGRVVRALGVLPLLLAAGAWAHTAQPPLGLFTLYTAHRYDAFEEYADGEAAVGADLLSSEETVEGPVKAFRHQSGSLVLLVGAKAEGTSPRDVSTTLLLAYLPAASHPDPESALVIGLGSGSTLGAIKPLVEDLTVVEINPGVIRAVARHGPEGLLDGVNAVADDGRSYIGRSPRTWDIIASGPSFPTESGVANLFTREFYEMARTRLTEDGVFCQWLPYFLLEDEDVAMMLTTFSSVFEHTYVWRGEVGPELFLVGSAAPFARTADEIGDRAELFGEGGPPTPFRLSRTPEEVRALVESADAPMNTDDHPRLEFRVVRSLVRGLPGT